MSLAEHSPGCYSKQSSKYPGISPSWAPLLRCHQTHYLLKILCVGSVTFCSPQGQRRRQQDAPQTWHHSCCPCTVQDSCPTGGKNLSPQGPIPPRSNRVQGRTHSVKARALGPVEPKLSGQPEILRCPQPSSHICAHSCTPLALSSPSSVFPQCLKALVPAVPALFPCTQLRPRAQLQTRTPQRSAATKHSLGSTPALPTQPRS